MAAMRCATLALSHALSFSQLIKPKGIAVRFLAVLSVVACESFAGNTSHTLQSFGVRVEHGRIVYPLPSHVALGLFNPDPLLDVACCAEGKVQIYQNLGNGLFDCVGERSVSGAVEKMEWRKEKMFGQNIPDQFSWGELSVTYSDGHGQILTREQLIPAKVNLGFTPQIPLPPTLDFRERWRSQMETQPSPFVAIDDLDRDGRIEVVYSFYQWANDTPRFVVYRCVGDDSFAVDWDTVITGAYGPFTISDVDKDGHEEVVLGRNGQLVLLECLGPGQYRYYSTNIGYQFPPFKVIEADVDHDGRNELVLLTSNPSPPSGQDATLIYVAEYSSKGRLPDGSWLMSFNQQVVHYGGYVFDMAVGQVDDQGWDEIVPAGGSFGVNEPVPIDYLWYNGSSWIVRQIYTGLQSGTTAPMFVNLNADSTQEIFIGGVGPIGHGSCYALDYVGDTTWSVMWADSSLRNTPLSVDAGMLDGQFIVAGANTVDRGSLDTLYTQLHVYQPSGHKLGIWQRDTASVQNFHILDIDNDGRTNLVAPVFSPYRHYLADYEYYGISGVVREPNVESSGFQLYQNYPNPFNPVTAITFYLQQSSHVEIRIYDVLGKEVRTLAKNDLPQGSHTVSWNGTTNEGGDAASGVYFYRMIAREDQGTLYTQTKKLLLVR